MIFIGLGANLSSPALGGPREACEAALHAMGRAGIRVIRRSRWYRSAPVPPSDQPWFVNGVAVHTKAISCEPVVREGAAAFLGHGSESWGELHPRVSGVPVG